VNDFEIEISKTFSPSYAAGNPTILSYNLGSFRQDFNYECKR